MAYTPKHDYRIKDALERGDDNKKVKGAELMEDFEAISSDLRRKEGQINDLIQNGGGSGGGGPVGWHEITGKPSTYPPSAHDHDSDYAPIDHNHDSDYAPIDHDHDSDYAPIDHDHAIDDLSDVNAGSPSRDDFLIWNGTNWVATDLSIIETELRFKGGIDMTGAAPSNPENGDLYVNNTAGEIDSSWGVIAGTQVLEGKFVGYGADAGRWFLLGDMAQAGVSSVSPGLGVDVDDSVPAEPVVSIDRVEVDKWYAAKDHDHDGDYLKDYTETDPVFSAHVSSGITQTDIDQWNAAASGTAPVVSVNAKTGAVVLDHTDVGAAKDDHTHDSDYADINHDHDLLYAGINHSHDLDDLSDVNTGNPTRDDLLIWNGSNWIADDFAFIETSLRFKGGIDMTGAAPSNPENGDLYINNTAGVIDASWGVLAGTNVNEGKFVGWAEAKGRWFLLGDMADVGVTKVSPGLGIDVDDSKPSEPVVSIDRNEVDKWYASPDDILWKQNGNDIYYNDGRVGIGTESPSYQLDVEKGGDGVGLNSQSNTTSVEFYEAGARKADVTYRHSDATTDRFSTLEIRTVSGDIAFRTKEEERMRIADGNVGIGTHTNAPTQRLEVASDYIDTGFNAVAIALRARDDADWFSSGIWQDGRSLKFSTGNRGINGPTLANTRMTIDPYGNVGIGTDNPDKRLDVLSGTENSEVAAFSGINTSRGLVISTFSDIGSDFDAGVDLNAPSGQGVISFSTGTSERMRIDSNGRVGIGGEPGTRSAVEIAREAKDTLTRWKSAFDERLKAEPEADKKAVTQEITGHDTIPTKAELIKRLTERNIGGGTAKLQVDEGIFTNTYVEAGSPWGNDARASVFIGGGSGVLSKNGVFGNLFTGYKDGNGLSNIVFSVSNNGDGYFSGTIYGNVDDVAAHIKAITPTQIANWDAGTGGGGGATTDGRISDEQIIHWDKAYGWGNHADAGYQPAGDYLTPSSLNGYATESWVQGQGYITSIESGNGTKVTGNKVEMSGSYTGTFTATGTVNASSLNVDSTSYTEGPAVHFTNDLNTQGYDGFLGRHYVIDYLDGFSTRLEFQDQKATLRTAGHLLSTTLLVGVQACANVNSASLGANPKGNVKSVTKKSTGRTVSQYVQDANLYVGALPVISAGIADLSAKGTVSADYDTIDNVTRFTQFGVARFNTSGSPVEGGAFVVVGMPVDSEMKSRTTSIEDEKRKAEYVNELFRKGEEAEYYDCDENGLAGSDKAWAAQTKSGGVEITRYIAVQEDQESYNKDLVMVRYADLPQEQWLFDAWKLDGKNVIVDLDKARSDVFATLKEQARFYLPRVSCLADIFDDDDEMKELKDLILGFKSKIRDKSVSVSELNAIMGRIRQEEQSDFAFKGF